ncbi:class A beta-lactamase [Pedobacter aquatilis]|uniref:class A beta-lactamase n=1 Tax=Pedobacter aquatilis TaxID=351343 RepID=UPI00292E8FB4|nr:class A beta-lactamase [Pedobacter aquatilis]
MSIRYFSFLLIFLLNVLALRSDAQQKRLLDQLASLSAPARGTVGVAFRDLERGEEVFLNGDRHFPMQSVMKFPLALAVLNRVDQGKLRLSDKIYLSAADLSIPFVSPIRDKYPKGDVELTIDELLRFTVSKSDNNGCDRLFQLLGGPLVVNDYVHGLGVRDISIVATEKEMGQAWDVQYRNWCTPKAMLKLLELFENGGLLSQASQHYLYQLMIETINAPARMKGLLPSDARVAHKPGTSGVSNKGIAAATNDVGIVELPNGSRLAIVVFVSDAKADLSVREGVVARISQFFWNRHSE